MIQPGEIYDADFDQAGPHPVIVVSREDLNRGRYALVVGSLRDEDRSDAVGRFL